MEEKRREAYKILLRRMIPIRSYLKVSQIMLESYKISCSGSEKNLNKLFKEACENMIDDFDQHLNSTISKETQKIHDTHKVVDYTDAINIISIVSMADLFLVEIREFLFKELSISEALSQEANIFRNSKIEKDLQLPLEESEFAKIWNCFMELRERRNVYVHRDFLVDEKYIKKAEKAGIRVMKGEQLTIDYSYFNFAIHNTVAMMREILDHCLRRIEATRR